MDWFISSASAQAAGAQAAAPSPIITLVVPIVLMILLLFFMSRSQNKRVAEHQKLMDAIQRGDEVVTSGGITGKIDDVTDNYFSLEIAQNVKIKIEKSAIVKLLPKGSLKA